MTTPTSAAIIAASHDNDLLDRFVALGATLGISEREVEEARTQLAIAPVQDGDDDTVATVYEYAMEQPRYKVGEDPDSVTDDHIRYALEAVLGSGD